MRNTIAILLLMFAGSILAQEQTACQKSTEPLTDPAKILAAAAEKGGKLKSFSANIMYSLTEDPDIFETTTIYTGTFRYLKTEKRQYAMIDFTTRQEDDLPLEKYHQRYLFDGAWLTRIDYQLKQVNRDQLAPEDKPEDVFKLISKDFPLIGFSGVDTLTGSYDIKLDEPKEDQRDVYCLSLEPKKEPEVAAKYSAIEFCIDIKTLLPKTIKAVSAADNSICKIELDGSAVDAKLDEKLFELTIPEGFTQSVNKLEE